MTGRSESLWQRAQELIPGGVNSPVRSFRSVRSTPFFAQRGEGPYLYDTHGRRYVDYVLSWGPLILGTPTPSSGRRWPSSSIGARRTEFRRELRWSWRNESCGWFLGSRWCA